MTRPSAECPRCGYNLDGTVSTWTTQCPIRGRCNECGLEFDWHRVFVLTVHPWLFEYHWRRRPFSRFMQTVLYAFRPRRFWREVRLTDPVHLMPAAVVTTLCVTIGYLLLAANIGLGDYLRTRSWGGATGPEYWTRLIMESALESPLLLVRQTPGVLVCLFAMPVIFALIPTTLRQARVKPAHIVRIFSYSLVAPMCVVASWLSVYFSLKLAGLTAAAAILAPRKWTHVSPWPRSFPPNVSLTRIMLADVMPGAALVAVCVLWMTLWWLMACRRYLKLDQPRLVVSVLSLILILLALAAESLRW